MKGGAKVRFAGCHQRRLIANGVLLIASLPCIAMFMPIWGQPVNTASVEELLRGAGMWVALGGDRARNSRDLRLRWRTNSGPGTPPASELTVVEEIEHSGPLPLRRSPEISPDHLVVAILDSSGAVRHVQVIVDPRLVRGEFPTVKGNLRKNILYRNEAWFCITLPQGLHAVEVRLLTQAATSGPQGKVRLISAAALKLAGAESK